MEEWLKKKVIFIQRKNKTRAFFAHDDVIKWGYFQRYWPFVRGIHRSPVNSPHEGQWRGALMFSLICVCINGWVNNREAGDLRRHRADYDVIVMIWVALYPNEFDSSSEELWVSHCFWRVLRLMRRKTRLLWARTSGRGRWPTHGELAHWGRGKMNAISQTTFWSAFYWMKMFEFRLKFHWSLFLRDQLTIFQHWFR